MTIIDRVTDDRVGASKQRTRSIYALRESESPVAAQKKVPSELLQTAQRPNKANDGDYIDLLSCGRRRGRQTLPSL